MKKSINQEDIKAGDLIRCEGFAGVDSALEYRAESDGDIYSIAGDSYLLDRPFKPVWGTVVGLVGGPSSRAAYLPGVAQDDQPWLTRDGWVEHSVILEYMTLNNPWVVIEGPEDGMDYV